MLTKESPALTWLGFACVFCGAEDAGITVSVGIGPFGVMYHHMTDGLRHPMIQGALTAEMFEASLTRLHGYAFLPAQEWLRRLEQGTLAPNELCVTFDDALKSQYDLALPVLKRLGLTAFWFVYSSVFEGETELLEIHRFFRNTRYAQMNDFYAAYHAKCAALAPAVDFTALLSSPAAAAHLDAFSFYTLEDRRYRFIRDVIIDTSLHNEVLQAMMADHALAPKDLSVDIWMNDDDLRALQDAGHVIGLHSYTHPTNMGRLAAEEQAYEYQRNFAHLRRVLGQAPTVVSHPSNSYNEITLEILRGLGVRHGFRANFGDQPASVLELPRADHTEFASMRFSDGRTAPADPFRVTTVR